MHTMQRPDWVFDTLQGRTVSFRNAVIIMTSNLGSADILAASRSAAAGGGADEAFSLLTRDRVMAQVGIYLRYLPTCAGWEVSDSCLHKKRHYRC
jgi:AAA domain (Cdc48 subfamily)